MWLESIAMGKIWFLDHFLNHCLFFSKPGTCYSYDPNYQVSEGKNKEDEWYNAVPVQAGSANKFLSK